MAAPRSHAEYLALRVFPGLDALRGLSILAVVWHHTGRPSASVPITHRGFLGVDVFFVLSGFLIVTLLLRERERHGRVSLRAFYLRRALRIFPLYYGVLAGLAVLSWLRPSFGIAGTFWHDLPWLVTYTANWVGIVGMLSITWSLAAEEQFYLLWPPVERWLGRAWVPIWLSLVLVNQCASFRLLDPWLPEGHRHDDLEILQTTFTPILFGVGLAHLLHDRAAYDRVAPWLARGWVRAGVVVGLLAILHTVRDLSGWPRLGLHLLMTAGLAALVVARDVAWGGRARAWVGGALARLGRVSYGVYLLHLFVATVVVEQLLPRLPLRLPQDAFVLGLSLTWLVAEASYWAYERRFLRLKERWSRA